MLAYAASSQVGGILIILSLFDILARFAVSEPTCLSLLQRAQCRIGALESGGPALGLHGVPWAGHSRRGHRLEERLEEI